ncbi:hypothetical protein F66182_9702, partial [Fusarium sp. NRRL 66182]
MAAICADVPIPSTETNSRLETDSTPTSPSFNRLRTPSFSFTPPPAARARDRTQDVFHSPEFQRAFQDAKKLMSNVERTLASSSTHNDPDSTMRKLYQEARTLADFEYPATRTVGFVGDSGV